MEATVATLPLEEWEQQAQHVIAEDAELQELYAGSTDGHTIDLALASTNAAEDAKRILVLIEEIRRQRRVLAYRARGRK